MSISSTKGRYVYLLDILKPSGNYVYH